MPYKFQGWTLYKRVGETGTIVLFFSKRGGARAMNFLPSGFKVAVRKDMNHPYLVPSLTLRDPYEIAFYKMWTGEPISPEGRTTLQLQPGESDTADMYGARIDFSRSLKRARDLEYVGRLEEAAVVYETLGLREEARKARLDARTHIVKTVQVDLNRLLDQVRAEGLVLGYHCPSCGSTSEISGDTTTNTLRACAFCGRSFETMAVTEFLRQSLG